MTCSTYPALVRTCLDRWRRPVALTACAAIPSFATDDVTSLSLQTSIATLLLLNAPQVLGLGVSLLYSSLANQFRVSERLWLFWLFWWNVDASKNLRPFRRPASAVDSTEVIQSSSDGEVRLLLSPNTALTPSLHVSVVSLQPSCEMSTQRACGVEFYYVLSGTGFFSQQTVVETNKISKGDCFVVDSGSMRWIINRGSPEVLLLLRATDGGIRYSSPTNDRIRHDPNRDEAKATSLEVANRPLRQVQWRHQQQEEAI